MTRISREELLRFLKIHGNARSRELCAHFGVSQPTMSNALTAGAREILKIGGGSRTRYALRREIANFGSAWSVFLVNPAGDIRKFATLYSVYGENARGEFAWKPERDVPAETFSALAGTEFRDGFFPDLPWFLFDHRPQGFIGRAIAREMHRLNFPGRIETWGSADILAYWLLAGDDVAGALIIGERMAEKFLSGSAAAPSIAENEREGAFPRLAEAANENAPAHSSAAGEQPKFLCAVRDAAGTARNVLVKYSGKTTSAAGRRMADLLVAEKTAADILGEAGFPVPRTEIVFAGTRCFLESERIDRHGARGRVFTVSLEAIDAAFLGENGAGNWATAAERGAEIGLFSEEDAARVRELCDFGRAIGNTDMHFGNLSFVVEDALPYRLAPIYDMHPAAYAPQRDLTTMKHDALSGVPATPRTRELARRFWLRLAADARVSGNFRRIARANAAAVDTPKT